MKSRAFVLPRRPFQRQKGVALVIILAFIVLLTGLVVAFLSMSMTSRQVANSSANQARTDIFIQGTVDVILGDLKQEIAAGSTLASPTPGVTIYTPKTPATNVPALAGATGAAGLENLLKRSAYSVPFYPGDPDKYDTNNYPPSNRAANVSTLAQSKNGRFLSPARWNKALLLAKADPASTTDFTPVGATAASGTSTAIWANAPDWILVARDGANPSAWNASLKFTAAGATPVIGRYAYAIYDEGGLLDMNVAGYPAASDISNDIARKGSLAFADLTQLPGLSGTSLATASFADNTSRFLNDLVGWRNYVTAGVSGTNGLVALADPGAGYTIASGSSYRDYVLSSTNGFLTTGNLSLSGSSSDRMFSSRQEMMSFLLQTVGGGTGADATSVRANLQNALRYMGTFSRDLNQPSLAPNPNRPKSMSYKDTDNYAGNDVLGKDDLINPSFLTVRVATSFTRNDGTQATEGDPLVNKRFALNRLAWLTYKGPSASRTVSDVDIQALLAPGTGITAAFLQEGTADNIEKYFGLTWNSTDGYWTYDRDKIFTLSDVVAANREPDFIELLKASINAGALAKGSTNPSGKREESAYFTRDTTLDYAILQIAANIIDQSDCDGYPTRLRFTSEGKLVEFRGVENLPYFYRLRNAAIIAKLPDPLPDPSAPLPSVPPAVLTDTGLLVSINEPEIWNPHDRNSSLGNPRPANLRFVADGALLDADGNAGPYNSSYIIAATNTSGSDATNNWRNPPYAAAHNTTLTPATFIPSGDPSGGAVGEFNADSTELDFGDANGTLFREPTLLTKPGVPAGSNLTMGPRHALRTIFTDSRINSCRMNVGSPDEGIQCFTDPLSTGTAIPYIGIYRGQTPIRWVAIGDGNTKEGHGAGGPHISTAINCLSRVIPTGGISGQTCRMQYLGSGGNWVTYDEKLTPVTASDGWANNSISIGDTPQATYSNNTAVGSLGWTGVNDPRTIRFGAVNSSGRGDTRAEKITTWSNQSNNELSSNRPQEGSGMPAYDDAKSVALPGVGGWYPRSGSAAAWLSNNPSAKFRYGLLSQNNPEAISSPDTQYYTDPDGVVRRAMAAYVPPGTAGPAQTTFGLPMALTSGTHTAIFTNQSQSRPIILNRPLRSVAELGNVFSDTPWKNLSLFTPESGYSGLLDVFCIQDTGRADAMVAGKVNLNTRQEPVLKAILAGAYADELDLTGTSTISPADADAVATALVARTTSTAAGKGPLANISELVGRWNTSVAGSLGGIDGRKSYTGFSEDLSLVFTGTAPAAAAITVPVSAAMHNIQRFREAPIRALSANGTTRVWNLMIDVVAQTGRYLSNANGLNDFMVEGEQRLWVHVAIDRQTGKIIDKSVEVVKE